MKQKENISSNNLYQYRYRLLYTIVNYVALLQLCGCKVTEILLYMHLKLF